MRGVSQGVKVKRTFQAHYLNFISSERGKLSILPRKMKSRLLIWRGINLFFAVKAVYLGELMFVGFV